MKDLPHFLRIDERDFEPDDNPGYDDPDYDERDGRDEVFENINKNEFC